MLVVGWWKGVFLWRVHHVPQREGIHREYSCGYTLQQNGVAERKNRTIVEAACTMLEEKNFPIYWAEAICTVVYLLIRSSMEGVHIMPVSVAN